jgi:SAM-dependent methyltransferase
MKQMKRIEMLRWLKPLYWLPLSRRFEIITRRKGWGGRESLSGVGSDLDATVTVRKELPKLLQELGVRSLLDAPCGDFHWMKEVSLDGVTYIGMDVVPSMIETNLSSYSAPNRKFIVGDISGDPLPRSDLILCRDCLVHLSNRLVVKALINFKKSGAAYLLTTTFPDLNVNRNIPTGNWRPLNLTLPPFNLPPPERIIPDSDNQSESEPRAVLGLWKIAELPPRLTGESLSR